VVVVVLLLSNPNLTLGHQLLLFVAPVESIACGLGRTVFPCRNVCRWLLQNNWLFCALEVVGVFAIVHQDFLDADNQPFEPWMDAEDGMAVVLKSTTTVSRWFFFVAQPPKIGRGNLARARCVPIGRHQLQPQEAGYRWHEPADAAIALFGSEAEFSMSQQWLLAWELSGWSPRPVLDPCWSPPTTPPPAPDPCHEVYNQTLVFYASGTFPGGSWEFVVPLWVQLQSGSGSDFYEAYGDHQIEYSAGSPQFGDAQVTLRKAGSPGSLEWVFELVAVDAPTGSATISGVGPSAESCAMPLTSGTALSATGWTGTATVEVVG